MTGHKRPRNRTKVMQPATNDRLPSREVIELARKAGLLDKADLSEDYLIPAWAALEEIDKFATLVAAAERKACAKIADDEANDAMTAGEHNPKSNAAWNISMTAKRVADAIRARGSSNAG